MLANKNMKYNKRSWFNFSRGHECLWIGQWFKRTIGKSWLDDNRGDLKENKWFDAWQTPRHASDGTWAGSESRRQFTSKLCKYLYSRGVIVYRKATQASRKAWRPEKPTAPTQENVPETREKDPPKPGAADFLDEGFRRREGLSDAPPFSPKKT